MRRCWSGGLPGVPCELAKVLAAVTLRCEGLVGGGKFFEGIYLPHLASFERFEIVLPEARDAVPPLIQNENGPCHDGGGGPQILQVRIQNTREGFSFSVISLLPQWFVFSVVAAYSW